MLDLINENKITREKELNELLSIMIVEANNNIKNMDKLLFEQLKIIRNKNEEIFNLNKTINYYKKIIYYISGSCLVYPIIIYPLIVSLF